MQYTMKAEHNRHFELFDSNNSSIGRLDYTQWFSIKAEITAGKEKYLLSPTNIWHTSIEINKDDKKLGDLKLSWGSNIIIQMENGTKYMFKRKGFWMKNFVLLNHDEREIAQMHADFQWSSLSFRYEIETDDNYTDGKNVMMLLLMVYCANFMHTQLSAGAF